MSREEMRLFIKFLDDSVTGGHRGTDWNGFYKELAKAGVVNLELSKERFMKKYQKLYNEIFNAYIGIRVNKAEYE